MKNIGLFGGSFNPPHMGHLIVCESIRSQLNLDTVFFIPTAQPPHKKDIRLAPPDVRFEMTKLAVQDNPRFAVSDSEIRRGGTSYTIDTLQEFHRLYNFARLYLMIGADNWTEFDTWKMPEGIMELADVVVMTRPGFPFEQRPSLPNVRFVDVPHIGISGTMIRLNIKSGRSIRYLVPSAVEEMIKKLALYHDKTG